MSELSEEDIHDVLRNSRRRLAIEALQHSDEGMTARELSEHIAEIETGESPPPRNKRQSAYVSLHQTHLPKMKQLDIIESDDRSNRITLTDTAGGVAFYLETVPAFGIAWSEYYLGVGILSLVTMIGAEIGVPILDQVPIEYWAMATSVVVILSATYQTIRQGSSIVNRLELAP